jgi:hypothetical protein
MAHRIHLVLLCGLLAVLSSSIAACSGAVSGQVSSKDSKTPIAQATVRVGDKTVTTDTSGRFTIAKVDTGNGAVAVSAAGFGPYSGSLDVQRGDNTLNVVLQDGSLRGRLRENASVIEPIKKATVTVAGQKVKVESGKFSLDGIPVGSQAIKVVAPGHENYNASLTIAPGSNSADVRLSLTPVETYMRYYLSYRFGRYRDAYEILHPDVRRHYSYKRFVKDMKGSISLGVKILGVHHMKKWNAAFAHKTYKDVTAVDRAYHYQDGWGTWTDNTTHHWVQKDGRWYLIWDWTE